MGSTFVNTDSVDDGSWEHWFSKPEKIWFQFVEGLVTNVILHSDSVGFNNNKVNINSIYATPHYDYSGVSGNREASEEQYFPLLRGITDVPVKGDQVLLCTFGKKNYYIGPINTQNSPNENIDASLPPDIVLDDSKAKTARSIKGQSQNFYYKNHPRLQKLNNLPLDDPLDSGLALMPNGGYPRGKSGREMLSDMHGDMMFEGRHGNSLRIGSRGPNPYMIISNGRGGNISESSQDGSIIGIFSNGSIRQHLDTNSPFNFRLSDSRGDKLLEKTLNRFNKTHTIETAFNTGPGSGLKPKETPEFDIKSIIYDYSNNQIFQTSDRITIDARKDSIFLSAFEHIHVGSGNSMTFSTSKSIFMNGGQNVITNTPKFIVNADNITIDAETILNLGKPGKDIIQPAVLGGNLKLFLEQLLMKIKGDLCTTIVSAISHHASPTEVQKVMDDFPIDDLMIMLEDGNPVYPTIEKPKPDWKSFILSNTVQLET